MKRAFCKPSVYYLLVCSLIFLSGCLKDKMTRTYKINVPIYQSLSEFRKTVKSGSSEPVQVTGKITVYGHYIFVSETYKGIHVIDNSDPANPKNVSFINIPGNEDLAIKGNTLYADAYGDLVSFDITDPVDAVAKNYAVNVFPDHSIYYFGGNADPDSINVVIGWTTRDTTVDYDPGNNNRVYFPNCANCALMYAASNPSYSSNSGIATNGSLARFSIINDFLYAVGYSSLTSFDISHPIDPVATSTVQVDWHVETIFPLKNKLFVGTNNGMFMYDVNASPSTPSLIGSFTHARGCDPVIADGNYAYITLNDSSACLGFTNELQIVNIQDLADPELVKSYTFNHPTGLSKDGNILFLCDGTEGLKVFDAANVSALLMIKQLKDAETIDVIAENGIAIVSARDGIYQYDYSDLNNIHLISKL
jgi:hypothetical protein